MQKWVVFSSSSGETFEKLWNDLSQEARLNCVAAFCDRECGALARMKKLLGEDKVFHFAKKDFEEKFLNWQKENSFQDSLVFLCGFFKLLSSSFISSARLPIVNTHPSLLPAFPGLDKKVHEQVHGQVSVSGFTVHLVNEEMDGGQILFQKSVDLDPSWSLEEMRNKVRELEQNFLPQFLLKLLKLNLKTSQVNMTSLELRRLLADL